MKKRILTFALATAMTVTSVPATSLAQENNIKRAVSTTMEKTAILGNNCYFVDTTDLSDTENMSFNADNEAKALEDLTQIEDTNIYYTTATTVTSAALVYGTSTLNYTEYYAGDTSVEKYDAVTSATTGKNTIFVNEDSTEVVTEPADQAGYQILGVKNVPVAVDEKTYTEAKILETAGALPSSGVYAEAAVIIPNEAALAEVPQYKVLNADGTYSATKVNVADVVTDAKLTLKTTSVWGAYELDVEEVSTKYIRNTRDDEGFEINGSIQGLIIETTDGTKVGMRYTEEIWVQPYETSFNLGTIAADKLIGKTVNKITYVMPNAVYVYEFGDGVYMKLQTPENNSFTATTDDNKTVSVELKNMPKDMENAKVSVSYKEGRTTTYYAQDADIVDGVVTLSETLLPNLDYTVTLSSDNYADKSVSITSQKASIADYTAILDKDTFVADGTEKKPVVTIEGLTEGVDYTVEYKDNINVGTATVTVTGTGSYEGSIVKTYTITAPASVLTPTQTPVSTQTPTQTPTQNNAQAVKKVKVTAVKGLKVKSKATRKATITYKKNATASGYEVQYALNKKFTKAGKVTIAKAKTVKVTLKKLKAKKKYYVRVRAYKKVSGKKYYSAWTVKTVKVK